MTPQREEFLARRKQGIGGSDIAAVCGLSPWRSPLDVYYDKLNIALAADGLGESHPIGQTAALWWGSELEALIAKAYTVAYGEKVCRYNRLLVHPEHSFFIGDVDRLAYEGDKRPFVPRTGEITTSTGIEIKTSRYASEEWGAAESDVVPMNYLLQVQWYMGLCKNLQRFRLVPLFCGSEMRRYTVHRDDAIIARLQEIGFEFWTNNVQKQVPPPPRSYEEVKRLYPAVTGKQLLATLEVEQTARKLKKVSGLRLKLEKSETALKDTLAVAMGQNEELTLPDGKVIATFKESKNGRILRLRNF